MKKLFYVLFFLLVLSAGYFIWSETNRVRNTENIFPKYVIGKVEQFGNNNGKGNVIALSPYLHTTDFSSQTAFYNMLHYYFSFAQRRNLLNDSTIIVLPEYIGTWLVVANEKRSIYADTSLEDGMKTVVLSNIAKFSKAYFQSNTKDKTKEAIFRMKAENMLEIYQTTFSKLAKEFKVTIVAGSIVLPNPVVKNGQIQIDTKGKLYNVSALFDTNGNLLSPLTKKMFPIKEEKTFTCSATKNEIPVYKTTAGNLAILICADSWYPENYNYLKDKKVDVLIVPSFVSGNDSWSKKWKGYNGAPTPNDVKKLDIGTITEQDAWLKYAMTGRILQTNIKAGVNVFLRGELWNLGSDGRTLIKTTKYIKPFNVPYIYAGKETKDKTGSLVCVWLE